jgi:ribose transport system substrate-binding protein
MNKHKVLVSKTVLDCNWWSENIAANRPIAKSLRHLFSGAGCSSAIAETAISEYKQAHRHQLKNIQFGLALRQAARSRSVEAFIMKLSAQTKFVCLLAVIALFSAACGSSPAPEKTRKKVAFITNTASNFWKIAQQGCQKADAELADVDVVFKMASGGTVKEQERYINESLRRDAADAIAISPIDPVAQKQLLNDTARKVLLITQDSDAPDSDRALYLGADNRAAGRQAGELMKKALPQGGKVMVFVGKRELENSQDRFEGIKEALQGSKVEVLDLMTDDNERTKARDNALEAMQKHPNLAGMIGLWSYNGPAILRAVQAENKVGKIKIVCFDDEQDTLAGIKEGAIFGTVAQQPFEYGYQAVQVMAKILKGDKSVIPESKQLFIPTVVIQRNNVDEYRRTMEQALGEK